MDVRAWLQKTADREPPDEGDRAGFPEYLRPERHTAEEHTRVQQGERKRASSEPYSVQRRPSRGRHGGHGHGRAASNESSSDDVRDARTGTTSSRSSSNVKRRESAPDYRFNRTFERRPRYKTKEDRYEPKAKKRRKEHESRKGLKSKSKSKRRKLHRSGDGARTAGLVTSFQLKDGPKDNRLTLRPADASAGIFKHGRAGAPIMGKGSGLPDLVFNEMRFLRRPREHQNEICRNHPEKERSERTNKQPESNIPTYFEKQHTEQAQPEQQGLIAALDRRSGSHPQEIQEAARVQQRRGDRDVEAAGGLSANSFLDFGSRGPNQAMSNANRKGNSCYTWSESVSAPKSSVPEPSVRTIMPVAHSATFPTEQENADRPHRTRRYLGEKTEGLAKRPRTQKSTGRWVRSKRPQGSASVKVYHPTVNAQSSRREYALSTRDRSSLSLPRSGQDLLPTYGRAFNSQLIPGSCRTSDILGIRDEFRECGDQSALHQHNVPADKCSGKENEDPSTSTPTSKLLRHAFHAITGAQPGKTPRTDRDGFEDLERNSTAKSGGATVQYRNRVATAYPQPHGRLSEQHAHNMPQRGFSRSTDTSHAKQQQPVARPPTRAVSFMDMPRVTSQPSFAMSRNQAVIPDGEMLDNVPKYRPFTRAQQYTFTNSRQAEDLVRRLNSNQQQGPLAPQRADPAYLRTPSDAQGDYSGHIDEVEGADFLRTDSEVAGFSTGHPYSHTWSKDDAPHSVRDPGRGKVQRERMPAFWKPNKLY